MEKGARPTLHNFAIVDLGEIKTEIKGNLNILNFILNKFNNFVINIIKDVVALALGPPMKVRERERERESKSNLDRQTDRPRQKHRHIDT